jgi:hypothetical protein
MPYTLIQIPILASPSTSFPTSNPHHTPSSSLPIFSLISRSQTRYALSVAVPPSNTVQRQAVQQLTRRSLGDTPKRSANTLPNSSCESNANKTMWIRTCMYLIVGSKTLSGFEIVIGCCPQVLLSFRALFKLRGFLGVVVS